MKQIQIQYQGEYLLDANTTAKNPLCTVTACKDDMEDTVFVTCVFSGDTYSYSRETGSFPYAITWDNEDVERHMNTWMNARKL